MPSAVDARVRLRLGTAGDQTVGRVRAAHARGLGSLKMAAIDGTGVWRYERAVRKLGWVLGLTWKTCIWR